MTHEDFQQRINRSNQWTREQIMKFLDGEFEDPILLGLFEIWQTGDNVKLFDEMKKAEIFHNSLKSLRTSSMIKPKDADLPRRKENNNTERKNVSRR